jgi:hypothetical protein
MPSKCGRGSTENANGPGASGDPAEAAVLSPKALGQHEWCLEAFEELSVSTEAVCGQRGFHMARQCAVAIIKERTTHRCRLANEQGRNPVRPVTCANDFDIHRGILVASRCLRDLLLCAKHLFVAAITVWHGTAADTLSIIRLLRIPA